VIETNVFDRTYTVPPQTSSADEGPPPTLTRSKLYSQVNSNAWLSEMVCKCALIILPLYIVIGSTDLHLFRSVSGKLQ
jgi:hypothetical protein